MEEYITQTAFSKWHNMQRRSFYKENNTTFWLSMNNTLSTKVEDNLLIKDSLLSVFA